jgi:hypothetical protein
MLRLQLTNFRLESLHPLEQLPNGLFIAPRRSSRFLLCGGRLHQHREHE